MNSERKSFVAYIATAALLLSSLTAVFAAPLASVIPAASAVTNSGTALADAATPTITATLPSVTAGSTDTITGTGFAASTVVTLTLSSGGFVTTTTNTAGEFPSAVTVPAPATPGTVTVTAAELGLNVATTSFVVTAAPVPVPAITASPASVAPGGTETISGTGFTANTTVNLVWPSGSAFLATDANGNFPAPGLAIVAPATSGAVTVQAVVTGTVAATTVFTVTGATITVAPTGTVVPAETLTITATGFNASTTVGTITFTASNGVAATTQGVATGSGGTLVGTIVVPSTARAGNATITVTTVGTTPIASAATTVVVGTPALTISPLPSSTTIYAGTNVTISGVNFTANTPVSVTFTLTQTTSAAFTNTNVLATDQFGNFAASTLAIPLSAVGVYTATATDANGVTASIVPFTITAPVATGTSSVSLATTNGNSCTIPSGSGASVAIAPGTIVSVTALGFASGTSVSIAAGGTTLTTGTANASGVANTTATSNVLPTFSLTPTELATGSTYTLNAIASNGATIGTSSFYYCPATQTIASGAAMTLTSPMSATTVTGQGFAAGGYTNVSPASNVASLGGASAGELVSETYYLSSATTPVTFSAGAPGVTAVGVVTADVSNGSFTTNITPTTAISYGVYTLRGQGMGNTNITPNVVASGLVATTQFTETAGAFTVSPGPLYPGQTFSLTNTNGFNAGDTVLIQPWGGSVVTTTANSSGGIAVSNLMVPAGAVPGNLTIFVTDTVKGAVAGVNGLPSSLLPTVPVTVPVSTTLTATPNSVQTGGTITVTGSGFIPNQPVSLTTDFQGVGGLVSAGGTVMTTTATATGLITSSYVVSPSVFVVGGAYEIVATSLASPLNMAVAPISVTNIPGTTGGVPGVSNAASTFYFPIGYTGRFATNGKADYDETISVLNPDSFAKTVTFTYQIEGSSTPIVTSTTLAANSDIQESVNHDVGNDMLVSAVVTANGRISAQEITDRAAPGGVHLDSGSVLGSTSTSNTWYFAEGYAGLSFQEYLTVQNPGSAAASVTINFVPQGGSSQAPITMTEVVPANSRVTTNVTRAYLSFPSKSVGMIVNSNVPVVAGREMYWGPGAGSGKPGYDAVNGQAGAAKQFFFANGSDTNGDQAFVTVINPAPTGPDATVLVAFYSATGTALGSTSLTVSANTRETVVVNNVISTTTGGFYTTVSSDQPIMAEQPQYIGGSPNDTVAHPGYALTGAPAGLTSVLFPNANTSSASGGTIAETVYLLNTGATSETVNGTYYTSGGATVQKSYTVAAGAVVAVNVNTDAGNLAVGPLGASFTTTSGQFVASEVSSYNAGASVIGSQGQQ